jgi:hypothetical protein
MTIAEDFFMLPPSWDSSVRSIFEFKTSIRKAITGYEARNALLEYVIRRQEYSIKYRSSEERNYALGKLYRGIEKLWGIPFWGFGSPLTAEASDGQPILSVDTTSTFYEVGQLVCVFEDYDNYEVEIIQSKTSSSITLSGNLVDTWPLGTLVYPILQGYIDSKNKIEQETSIYGGMEIKQREVIDDSITREEGSYSYETHRGFFVFNRQPNWASGVKLNVGKKIEVFKGLVIEYAKTYQDESEIILDFEHLFVSRAELYEVVSFFIGMRGRWGAFWVPTWTKDVVITAAIGSSDTTIQIEDIDYEDAWSENMATGRWLYFLLPNNTEIIRKVVGWPSSTQVTIGTSLGVGISTDQLKHTICSFLLASRFNSDELSVEHLTTVASTVTIDTHSLPDDKMWSTTTTCTTTTITMTTVTFTATTTTV